MKRRVDRRYVLTRFDRRRKMSQDVRDQLTAEYGDEVCASTIAENVAVAESPAMNRDVLSHHASSTGARDYMALHEELRAQGFF